MASLLSSARSRYHHLCALYLAYHEAVAGQQAAGAPTPFELPPLTLLGPERGVALRLRIWDRRSLCDAFPEQFSERQRRRLQRQRARSGPGEELFLEAIACEEGRWSPEGAWYVELLKRGVFGNRA
jgi:hypothetical protein